ncbi:tripartite tricarboxylate transporter substrate binding protein [Microbacteriaceae bacterium K1510]|nr:tripartite tricarboxylate transporter substrate binding protein [Microbacteriaceae bacterium K1510]
MPKMKFVHAAALAAVLVAFASPSVSAQDSYPNKTVRILVGFVPGSSMDAVARLMANEWSQRLKGQFVVENRPGAASAIAADMVARAPKDGYTLLTGGTVNVSTGLINTKQSFDLARDFAPVIAVAGQPMILAVHPSLGVSTLAEFIALAKSKPGALSYGSTGIGATPHLFTELFAQRTGIKMTHVPYQGSPQATTDLLAGRIELMFSPATAVLPHIQSGALKALAVSSARRAAAAPQVPTLKEAGVDLDATVWFAIWAPAGTPRAVIDQLSRTGNEALKSAEAQALLTAQGFDPIGGSPDDFARLQTEELAKWKAAVEAAGIGK